MVMSMNNRRDFVKQSLLATAAWPVISVPGLAQTATEAPAEDQPAPKPGSRMRFGLVTYLWGQDWDLPTLLANCAKTGSTGVELRVDHAHKVSAALTAEQRKAVKKRFADSGVVFVGMGCNWEFHSPDAAKVKANIEGAKADVVLSHDCGGSGVKVKPNSLPKGVPVEKTCEQIGRALNDLGRFAAGYKQEIRVEVHGSGTSELPIMKQIFDHVIEPNVGICWNCNGEDLKGEGLVYNFELVKKRFGRTVHVRELNMTDYPYQQLIDLFVKMDYVGWILLEARTKPKDRIAALIEQRKVFEEMVRKAQVALGTA